MPDQIGFLGPGLMGRGIVLSLLKGGHQVRVFEHRPGLVLDDLATAGAAVSRSLEEIGRVSSLVFLCLPSSKEVEAVILADHGLLDSMQPGGLIVDLTTSDPRSTKALAGQLATRGVGLLDAPMTGGPSQALTGELNLIVGGQEDHYERCLPVFATIAKNVFHVGPVGHGNIIKLINNFLGQLTNAGLAEVLPLAAKAGIDIRALYDVVRVSGGYSRVFEEVVPSVCERRFDLSFEIQLAHKDMLYMSTLGRELNTPLPMVNGLLVVLDLAKASGLGGEDTNALVKLWEEMDEIKVERRW